MARHSSVRLLLAAVSATVSCEDAPGNIFVTAAPQMPKMRRDEDAAATAADAAADICCCWLESYVEADGGRSLKSDDTDADALLDIDIDVAAFDPLLPFEGLGALSAGADAALLFDYEPTVRGHILDLLFTPGFPGGASLQILKVEIPGDVQSTCGSESSHEHFPGDLSYERGYEYRLMYEARRRNPSIRIYALEWSVPGWVGGNGSIHTAADDYSAANRRYTLNWLRGARDRWNVSTVDFLGFWNEPGALAPPAYVLAMRAELDAHGFSTTKLVTLDTGEGGAEIYVKAMANNPALQRAVHAFGFHGGPTVSGAAAWLAAYKELPSDTRPQLWASEDGNLPCSMAGAKQWAQTHQRNWLALNVTATVRWSLIWAAYPGTICNGAGLLRADQPWSGRFQRNAPNLAASAHITRATAPGWFQLPIGRGSETIDGVGSVVTWVNGSATDAADFTIVIEALTAPANYSRVVRLRPNTRHTNTLRLFVSRLDPSAMAQAGVDCEACEAGPLMARQPDLHVDPTDDGSFRVTVLAGNIYTATTLEVPSPPSAAAGDPPADTGSSSSPVFPLPLARDFATLPLDAMPRFFNNYEGSFSIARDSDGRKALKQWVTRPPLVWHFVDNEPLAIVAPGYQSYEVSTYTRLDLTNASDKLASYASVCGRMTKLYQSFGPKPTGYCLELRASQPPPPPPPPPPPGMGMRAVKCDASGSVGKKQQWQINRADKSIRSESGGCLTLGGAAVEPADCGTHPLPPCPPIPNASPLTLTACATPPLATQKWTTALLAGAHNGGTAATAAAGDISHAAGTSATVGKWIQFDGPDSGASPCMEVNMASVHAGAKTPVVDSWSCVANSFKNEVWTWNSSTAQLISNTVGLPLCLEAPALSPPLPPPPPVAKLQPMWRLIAHPSYRFGSDVSGSAAASTTALVLGSSLLPSSFDVEAWHTLKLTLNGSQIAASIDGNTLIHRADSEASTLFDHGLVGIGSSWNVAFFANISIVPLQAPSLPGAALSLVDTNTGITTLASHQPAEFFGVKLQLHQAANLTAVARFRAANSTRAHNVSLFALDNSSTPCLSKEVVASAIVDMAFAAPADLGPSVPPSSSADTLDSFGFGWAKLRVPVHLHPGEYILAAEELPGSDPFYLEGANGPCAGNSDGHDGGSPWLLVIPSLEGKLSLLGASRSVGGRSWDVSMQSDQSQHAYGPVNLALEY